MAEQSLKEKTAKGKEQVIPYLDDLDDDARQIGAVNVIPPVTDSEAVL